MIENTTETQLKNIQSGIAAIDYKQAVEWAMDLDFEQFNHVVTLLKAQHDKFNSKIDDFARINKENAQVQQYMDYLKDYLDQYEGELTDV